MSARLSELSVADAARRIAAGDLTSEALVTACLERIESDDPQLHAWVHVDRDLALAAARTCDVTPASGPLHGIPVGIKDIINTHDMPTQHNSRIYQGHRPGEDAACVALLRAAGAVILGKTHTVEFASVGAKPPTRNPRDPGRTPGGSSSGSGAAVGAGMVPLALGTQTGGSTIRPASFCGAFGMKPTFGTVSFNGAKHYAPSLDTIGWIARGVDDLSLVAQAFGLVAAPPPPRDLASLRIGLCRTPHWPDAEPASRDALAATAAALAAAGAAVEELELPSLFDDLTAAQDTVMHGEGRYSFEAEYRSSRDLMHPETVAEVENVRGITAADLRAAHNHIAACRAEFDSLITGYAAWLTPSVPGEAPLGIESTGEATFNRMWTALHSPCITLPGHIGPNGLPVGIQLIGPRYADEALLAVASAVAGLMPGA